MQALWERPQKEKLLLIDTLLFMVLVAIAFALRTDNPLMMLWTSAGFYLVVFVNLVSLYIFGTYDFEDDFSRAALVARIGLAVAAAAMLILFFNFVLEKRREGVFGRGVLLGAEVSFFLLAGGIRLFIANSLMLAREKSKWLIIAGKDWFFHMNKDIEARLAKGQYFVEAPVESLHSLKQNWTGVVVAAKDQELTSEQSHALLQARFEGRLIIGVFRFYERFFKKIPLFALSDAWLIHAEGFVLFQSPIVLRLKRITDIFVACVVGVLTLPVMAIAAVLIRLESKGPAIYRQQRTGKDGRVFTIYKFRSMRTDAEKDGAQWAQEKDPRVTALGRFTRATRIDELPQLWNVLKGDMSFVGPRPERPEFNHQLAEKIPFYELRHSVRPGLTGWAQVMYPYGASVEDSLQKVQFDLFYIKNHNLLLDLLIILRTVRVVLFGHGR